MDYTFRGPINTIRLSLTDKVIRRATYDTDTMRLLTDEYEYYQTVKEARISFDMLL